MIHAFAYCALLLVPGLLLVIGRGGRESAWLYAIAASWVYAVLALAAAMVAGLDARLFGAVWAAGLLPLATLAWRRRRAGSTPSPESPAAPAASPVALALVITVAAAYALWAGPYLELPSDAVWHMAEIRDQFERIAAGAPLSLTAPAMLFSKFQYYAYFLTAYPVWLAGSDPAAAAPAISAVNTVLVVSGFYVFALRVLERVAGYGVDARLAALAATAFFVLHFGIGVFSFVRYYTFGPVFINYAVYLAVLLSAMRWLESRVLVDRHAVFIAVAMLVMAMVHKQETLFAIVMLFAMTGIRAWRLAAAPGAGIRVLAAKPVVLLLAGLAAYLVLHGWLYLNVVRNDPLAHGVMTEASTLLPFLDNLYVMKPGYQFYQVITVWGVAVYLLYAFAGRPLWRSDVIAAGMLMPLLTLFNPVFTDFFLRISWPEVMWRLAFVVPLQLVGGWFVARAVRRLAAGAWTAKLRAAAMLALLAVLLLPFETRFFVNPYSKLDMLGPVPAANDARHFETLMAQLRALPPANVITDPVTGYAINAATAHEYPGYKFTGHGAFPVSHLHYDVEDLAPYRGWLLVVNRRDGGISRTGAAGRHWSPRIMQVSRFYGPGIERFIEDHPDKLETLWQGESEAIYRIR